jgi:eukaryotic-like serine/threonine-protein kinase
VTAVIELAPGAALAAGRYRLERLLGSGGMAAVWLAYDERLGRRVAVKLLADVLALDASYVERFRREATIAARLWHPNLVRVYDFALDGGRPLLVMELVEGPTLSKLLRDRAPLPVDPCRLASELLGALDHIHAAGVVHRDVKPANVLLDHDWRARLTDFGIAQPGGSTRLTLTGAVIGTIGYLAPEVARGDRATPRSDLYSLGVVLAACADRRNRRDTVLERLIERLTAEDAHRRPRSAAEALALLGAGRGPTAPTLATRRTRMPERPAPTAIQPPRERRVPGPLARTRRTSLFERPLHATAAGVGVGLALVAIIALVIALSSGGAGRTHRPTGQATAAAQPPPPSAPLGAQLDALDRAVSAASRR